MDLNLFIGLIAVIIGLVVYYFKSKFSYWERHGFEYAKSSFPFGNLKGVGTKLHMLDMSKKLYDEFKGRVKVFGVYFFTAPVLFIVDLDTVKHILVKGFHNFVDRGMYVNAETDPLSASLFSIEGQEWKTMRAKLTPTFTSGKMKMMFGTVQDICQEMIGYMNQNEKAFEIEMKEILARFTTDVIGSVAFGLEMNSMRNPDAMFRKMGKKSLDMPPKKLLKLMLLMNFRKFAQHFGFMFTDKDVSDFFLTSIKETVDYREKNNVQRNDFLSLLMQLKNQGKIDGMGESIGKITLNELSAQAFLFFLAGFETSSTTMTFTLYELALNQDIQDKVREHIQIILAKYDNKLTYEAMLDMKYLQMVIDETLRKYPVIDLRRVAIKDYKIPDSNLVIPAGTKVNIPVFGIHYDPEIYPDPKKFDPERFTEENKKNRHPMAHIPFGEGPRNCIGLRFGLMQTKIGLINLLTNFKILPSSRTMIPMVFSPRSPIPSPVDDMWLKIEKLHQI